MATLIVRQVEDRVVAELKERARKAGRSAEAEHRLILHKALARPQRTGAEFWKRLSDLAPNLTDAEWEEFDRAIRATQGRSVVPIECDDEVEEAGERTS